MELRLLGPLAVGRDGRALEIAGPKRRALLVLLGLHVGTPLGRERILETLWPDADPDGAASSLRVQVSRLRDVLEEERSAEPHVLRTVGSAYLLDRDAVEVDVDRFDALLEEARGLLGSSPSVALRRLDEALGLWQGRPLQDVEYEEFAQDEIRRLEAARIEAVELRAEALIETDQDAAAIDDLEARVRTDPGRERPVLLLMRALYRTGRQPDALRVARRHVRRLAELGLEPSPRARTLEERILSHDPTLLPPGSVSPAEIVPGRSIRGYELREEAGSGSVGVVFRAFQSSVGREVAVKAIRPELAGVPEFVRRFGEEARVIAGLEHPHIVPLYDFWREPAGAFLVMRWMAGGSLANRLEEPWTRAGLVRAFGQIAAALDYAHSAGVVHRDLRPANILFDASGNAYVSDFGIAGLGLDTGGVRLGRRTTVPAPYAAPGLGSGEAPSVASDVFALGVVLAEAWSGERFRRVRPADGDPIGEVVAVATASDPGDRYPDMAAFAAALVEAAGDVTEPLPRRVRRNPYKGLSPFEEGDAADFFGREDVVETLVDAVASRPLTAVIGASGGGKSSVVRAGLLPELRRGALPGSEEWVFVRTVPGRDPFEEFHLGLRAVAVGDAGAPPVEDERELWRACDAALDGPHARALLVVDQFEEVFSADVDVDVRIRFLDNLAHLAADPARRVRIVVTLRADFSDRPLSHPELGELVARGSVLLPPMRPEQIEDAIRRPAARVGVRVEPGLVAEIVRDVSTSSASLPLLQYVLSELFERRTENRLTIQAYRALGGVTGVLERRAEAVHASLSAGGRAAARQVFLRLVAIGDHGEETRRRLPVSELRGLGIRADVDEALDAHVAARLLTRDRDPVTRDPTVEVTHEAVLTHWSRYRGWIDDARIDLQTHRRLSAAAAAWEAKGEDPSYLLTGGPLAAAEELASRGRVELNELESRFLAESSRTEDEAREVEAVRRRQEAELRRRAGRRLAAGLGLAAIALLVAVLAVAALRSGRRADSVAERLDHLNAARRLAAASVDNLTAEDPQLSLLLALEAAEESLRAGDEIIPEAVDALHLAMIAPRPALEIGGADSPLSGKVIEFTADGSALAMLTRDGAIARHDPRSGAELGRIPLPWPALGFELHPDGASVLVFDRTRLLQLDLETGEPIVPEVEAERITTAGYTGDGTAVMVGDEAGRVSILDAGTGAPEAVIPAHEGAVTALASSPDGTRVVSGGTDAAVRVWDRVAGELVAGVGIEATLGGDVAAVGWNPGGFGWVTAAAWSGAKFSFVPATGEVRTVFTFAQHHSHTLAHDPTGTFVATADIDGFARLYTLLGGAAWIELPTGGVPVRDVAFDPSDPTGLSVATVGLDGNVRIWRDLTTSERTAVFRRQTNGVATATPDGGRYVFAGAFVQPGWGIGLLPTVEVIDAATGTRVFERSVPWSIELRRRSPAITDDGGTIAFQGGDDGSVHLVEVATGRTLVIPDSAAFTERLDFDATGTRLAGIGRDGTIMVWDTATGDVRDVLTGHGDREPTNRSDDPLAGIRPLPDTYRLTFHPVRPELASVGPDGTLRVWDLASGTGRVVLESEFELVSVDHSPDGETLAVADRTGGVFLLDPGSASPVVPEESMRLEEVSGLTELTFSPDGRLLAGAGPGPFVHLWDVETRRIVRRIHGSLFTPFSAVFVNGGAELRVTDPAGLERGYVLDPVRLLDLVRAEVTRELTDTECELYLDRPCDG